MPILLRVERVVNSKESDPEYGFDLWFLMPIITELAYDTLLSLAGRKFMVYPTGDIINEYTGDPVTDPNRKAFIMSGATGVSQIHGMNLMSAPFTIQAGPVYVFDFSVTV